MRSQLDRVATPNNFLTQLQALEAQVKKILRYVEGNSDPDLSAYLTVTEHAALTGDGNLHVPKTHTHSGLVPSGVIVMWSGSAAAIPSGWVICDGANGTPDLRDRFIVGAGSSYAVGATGGEASHTLTESEIPSHQHSVNPPSASTSTDGDHRHVMRRSTGTGASDAVEVNKSYGTSNQSCGTAGAHSHTVDIPAFDSGAAGGGAAHDNRPPYYALCFIMKM